LPVSDVVQINISVSGAGPTAAGFGEPMLLAYHTAYTDRVREYSSLAGVAVDFPPGASSSPPAYLMAQAVFAQTPAPTAVKIGRRALPYTQTLNLTCLSTSATDTYSFQLRLPGGSWRVVTVASTGVPNTDVATINTAVTALAITGLTATHSGAVLTLTMAAGALLDVRPDYVHMTFADVTTDPGIVADLTAIVAADPAFYGILSDSQSALEVAALAANVEGLGSSNPYLYIFNNSDTIDATSSTADIFTTLKTAAYTRTAGLYAQGQLLCYSAAAWMGRLFPTTPGSENWAFKTLAGVPADALTTSQVHNVEGKNASVYTPLAGLNLTQFGKRPDGNWIDITRGVDALTNTIAIGVLALEANKLKVPYTDAGIDMVRAIVIASLKQFTDTGFLADTPAPTVSVPLKSTVSSADRAARILRNVNFSATLAGAINSTVINGVLSV